MKWPRRRSVHASTIINTVSPNNSHHLVVMGGLDDDLQIVSDCWILNLSTFVWYQVQCNFKHKKLMYAHFFNTAPRAIPMIAFL